jgi:hypothetical protein
VSAQGQPLEGVRVLADPDVEVKTDREGRFDTEVVSERVSLMFALKGYRTELVNARGDKSPIRVVLQKTEEVRGHVRLESGARVSGVSVSLASGGSASITDERGEFAIPIAVDLRPDLSVSHLCEVKCERVADTEVNLIVVGSHLRLVVVDESGKHVPGAKLDYQVLVGGERIGGGLADANEEGRVSLLVPTGSSIEVSVIGGALESGPVRHELSRIAGVEDLRIIVKRSVAHGAIALTVRGDGGRPIKAVRVSPLKATDSERMQRVVWNEAVDGEGKVRLTEFPAGRHKLNVEGRSSDDWQLEFAVPLVLEVQVPSAGTAEAAIEFTKGGRLTVAFQDADGVLLTPLLVEVVNPDAGETLSRFAYQSENGWVDRANGPQVARLVPALRPGTYLVRCRERVAGQRFSPVAASRRVTITAGEITETTLVRGSIEE